MQRDRIFSKILYNTSNLHGPVQPQQTDATAVGSCVTVHI